MNVNFFLKNKKNTNTAINCIIRFRGERYKMATGVSVSPDIWAGNRADIKKGKEDAEVVNIQLDRFEAKVKELFEPHRLNKTLPSADEVRNGLKQDPVKKARQADGPVNLFLPFFISYYENTAYKTETRKKYITTTGWLRNYEKRINNPLTFDDINLDFYDDFKHWILSQKYRRRKWEELRHYSLNYFGSLIKCIKKVMRESGPDSRKPLHHNTIYNSRIFKTENEDADTIYLNVSELMKIHRFTATPENVKAITNDTREENLRRKAEALNIVKNKFLIGSFTALRVSDFNRLKEVNIQKNIIRIKPKKGQRKNEDVVIPIHPVIREILNSGFDIATTVSDQKINEHIKEVCQLVDINDQVTVSRTEGNKLTERIYHKYELVSTHTARRSGATNMVLAGIPMISVMMITGHTTQRSFMKYIKITREENANSLKEHPFFS